MPGSFGVLPMPPSVREVASRSDDGRSPYLESVPGVRTQITPSAALRATAPLSGSKRTRKLCGLPGNFAVMPRALPLGELASPSGLD